MRITSRVVTFAALSGLAAALAVTSPAQAQSGHTPSITINGVRQTTDLAGIHVFGWTADDDAPVTPIFISFSVDGGTPVTALANKPLSEIVTQFPQYGANHAYDLVIPASAGGHKVCMTAFSVNGGSDKRGCAQMDDIVKFEPQAIQYDTAHAVMAGVVPEQLVNISHTNGTDKDQNITVDGSKSTTDNKGWTDTASGSLTVETSVKVGVPFLAEGSVKVSATGSYSYTRNQSFEETNTFSWNQPVTVPAHSRVDASVMITHYTISVPYILGGPFRWRSGEWTWGTVSGTYTGTNSTDLAVNLKQFNLDGSPAARAARQLPARTSTASPLR